MSSNKVENTVFDKKKLYKYVAIVLAIVLLGTAVAMIEKSLLGKLKIKNNSGYDIEYIKVSFASDQEDNFNRTEYIVFEDLKNKSSVSKNFGSIDLSDIESTAILSVYVKFKSESNSREYELNGGTYAGVFKNRILIEFKGDAYGVITAKLRTGAGFFYSPANNQSDADSKFYIYLDKGELW